MSMKQGDYNYYDTPMGKESLKIMAAKQVARDGDLRLIKDISTVNNGKTFHKDLLEAVNIPGNIARANEERTIRIDIRTGMLVDDPAADKRRSREVVLTSPIMSYTLMQTNDGKVGFAIIGCTDRTVYMFLRDDLAYSFAINEVCLSAQEAVLKLYIDNVNKGKGLFARSASLIPGFFWKAFSAVHPVQILLNFDVLHSSGNPVKARLYLDPHHHEKCMLSVNGWVFGVDLNEYPLQQLSRGYNMKNKERRKRPPNNPVEQRRELEATSLGRPYMNALERKRMIDRQNRG